MMGDGREQSSGCVMASSSSPRCPHPHPPHIIFLVSVCSLSPFELVKPIYTRILQTFFGRKRGILLTPVVSIIHPITSSASGSRLISVSASLLLSSPNYPTQF